MALLCRHSLLRLRNALVQRHSHHAVLLVVGAETLVALLQDGVLHHGQVLNDHSLVRLELHEPQLLDSLHYGLALLVDALLQLVHLVQALLDQLCLQVLHPRQELSLEFGGEEELELALGLDVPLGLASAAEVVLALPSVLRTRRELVVRRLSLLVLILLNDVPVCVILWVSEQVGEDLVDVDLALANQVVQQFVVVLELVRALCVVQVGVGAVHVGQVRLGGVVQLERQSLRIHGQQTAQLTHHLQINVPVEDGVGTSL